MILQMITYLIEVSVITSILYLFYRYLYFKLAYFQWSRYYLYGAVLISLIIPLIPNFEQYTLFNYSLIHIPETIIQGENSALVKINKHIEQKQLINFSLIEKILLIIWISGVIRYFFITLNRIFSIFKLIKSGNKIKKEGYSFIYTEFAGSAFSFFNYIFLNSKFEKLSETEKIQIINHEKIHAEQYHSFDNVFFEFFRAVFWFNPISKLIAADIKIIHEFITDNILTGNKNKPEYSKLILKLSAKDNRFETVSNFSKEEIKNRISLISFPEKEKIRKRRFIISIPILILTVFALYIIMSTFNAYMFPQKKENKIMHKPFDKNNYSVISPWFENKTINGLSVSHKETDYEVKSFSNIYAIDDGIISNIKTKDVFGLKEISLTERLNSGYTIEIKGLHQVFVKQNDSIKKGQIIAKSGDIRLYPKISIALTKNNKSVNPEKLY